MSTTITEERAEGVSFLGFGMAMALVLWATAFVGIRVAVVHYPPGPLALLRFSIASVLLGSYLLAASKRRSLLKAGPKDWLGFLSLGLTGIVVYHVALNTGEQTVSAGAASLLVNTTPVFTVLLAVVLLGDRLGKRGTLGTTIAFGGAALAFRWRRHHLRRSPRPSPLMHYFLRDVCRGAVGRRTHRPARSQSSPAPPE